MYFLESSAFHRAGQSDIIIVSQASVLAHMIFLNIILIGSSNDSLPWKRFEITHLAILRGISSANGMCLGFKVEIGVWRSW